MEQRILNYRKYMDALLMQEDVDWVRLREEHLVQVGFFQHERLIHLIVTVIFAVLTVLCICMSFALMAFGVEGGPGWLLIVGVFLVLLIPYVRHYYILENEVQKMYRQYDRIVEKIEHFQTFGTYVAQEAGGRK
ncbi:MAG: hypothetical protein IJ747_08330 [Lachnospiraceae bacterium]|nr:hypothetical protein [Lachnospiraceae bacterium]